MKKIILIGYMGSGKSIIGELVAKNNQLKFFDLDLEIEKQTNRTVSEIFSSNGELFFRKKEHEILLELLSKNEKFLLSLGGGTPCYYKNHEVLQSKGVISIYLKASVATILDRLQQNTTNRPLLARLNIEEQKEFIAKHLFERSYFYSKANFTINVDSKSINQVAQEVQTLLG